MHMPRKLTPEELSVAPRVWRKNGAGVLVKGVDPEWYRALVASDDVAKHVTEIEPPQPAPSPPPPAVSAELIEAYRKPIRPAAKILARVADAHGVKVRQIVGPRGWGDVILARQHAAYELKKLGKSLPEIGRVLGGRDHTTVLHAIRVWPRKAAKAGLPVDLEPEA